MEARSVVYFVFRADADNEAERVSAVVAEGSAGVDVSQYATCALFGSSTIDSVSVVPVILTETFSKHSLIANTYSHVHIKFPVGVQGVDSVLRCNGARFYRRTTSW